jgi:hypothetical protein
MLLVLLSTSALRSSCPLSCNDINKLVKLHCLSKPNAGGWTDGRQKDHLCLHSSAVKCLGQQSFAVCFQLNMTNACFQWCPEHNYSAKTHKQRETSSLPNSGTN